VRPGLHLSNCSPITVADEDIVRRWTPLSALLAMNNIVEDEGEIGKLISLWELAGRPLLILRKYFNPEWGLKPGKWGLHAIESTIMARRCMALGVPPGSIAHKPFNEVNMPTWALNEPYGEGFGDKPEQIERYGKALNTFIDVAKNEEPEILIGGPHLTIGNHDVRFPNDPEGRYYYGPNSLCQDALDRLDLHFVHCYGFRQGQYKDPAHGLRFLEYEKYFSGKPIYIVEGCYGIQGENGNAIDPAQNNVRGEDTVAYLRLLDQYPQVKGITLWIGGWTGWQEHRHSDDAGPGSHRPVVFYVERYVKGELPAPPPAPPDPGPEPQPEVKMRAYLKDGSEIEPAELLEEYAMSVELCEGPGFRVVELRERCESNTCDVHVKGMGGELLVGQAVRWGWPGTEISQPTGYDGRVGFVMGLKSYYNPAQTPGPHWVAVVGTSDLVSGIGMIPGTVHCTVNVIFQYLEVAPEPQPEPPTPEPPPEKYILVARLNQAPHGFKDYREQVKSVAGVDMKAVTLESFMAGRIDESGAPLFGKLDMIVVHHLGGAYFGALELVEWAVNDCEEVHHDTCPYHFLIEKSGRILFMVAIKYLIHHAYGANNTGIGIVFEDEANEKQMESGRFLIAALEELMGGGWGASRHLGLMPHSMVWNGKTGHTTCPGAVWPKILRGERPDLRRSL